MNSNELLGGNTVVKLVSDYTANGITYPKGTLAGLIKASQYQVVLLFLDGKKWVLSPSQIEVVKP